MFTLKRVDKTVLQQAQGTQMDVERQQCSCLFHSMLALKAVQSCICHKLKQILQTLLVVFEGT